VNKALVGMEKQPALVRTTFSRNYSLRWGIKNP
jgi:hypothetical protein